jgi:hypothetical protein
MQLARLHRTQRGRPRLLIHPRSRPLRLWQYEVRLSKWYKWFKCGVRVLRAFECQPAYWYFE